MKTPRVPVAQEGYPFLFLSTLITLIFALLDCSWLAYAALAVTMFILFFFRDPERFIPPQEHAVVSPADGRVIVVEQLDEPQYLQKKTYKVSIFMNIFNVHVNRAPLTGTVAKINYTPGTFYSADSEKGGLHNENCVTVLTAESGVKIVFVQIAGLIARRIINWLEVGDRIGRGERFGLIRFGSRVDIYLPADTAVAVKVGQKVRAGETIIGYLNI